MTHSRIYIGLLIGLFVTASASAQIRLSKVDVTKWILNNFTGQGVVVGGIKIHGNPMSMGTFSSSANALELPKGLALSTGYVLDIASPNNKYNQSYSFGDAERDADMQKYVKPNLYDVTIIEFDFVPLANSLQFNYQFGSEEFPEYVGSTYNDSFAFFVSDDSTTRNIALIPGQKNPVTINSVNHKTNSKYFIDNNVFADATTKREAPLEEEAQSSGFFSSIFKGIKSLFGSNNDSNDSGNVLIKPKSNLHKYLQFDGITKKLVAQTYVVPYKKYHLKIIIADVSDNIYDSGVFIEDKSLTAKRDTTQPGFIDYLDLGKIVDPKKLLTGKKIEDLLPDTVYMEEATIYFDFDKADITALEMKKIKRVAATFDRIKNKYAMRIIGHTDSIGSLQYNMDLSRKRNQAVMNGLQEFKSIEVPVEITEDAFLRPAAINTTDTGRMKNRRVEILFVKHD